MNLLKRSLYVFASYIVLDILFLTMVLPSAARDNIHYIVSVATIYIVASTLYGYSWKCGRKDIRTIEASKKHDPDYNGKFNPYYGFLIALPFTAINVILAILAYNFGITFDVIFKLLNYCCWSFMSNSDGSYIHLGVAFAILLPLVVCGVGYLVGKTGFSVSDKILPKIIYKKKK